MFSKLKALAVSLIAALMLCAPTGPAGADTVAVDGSLAPCVSGSAACTFDGVDTADTAVLITAHSADGNSTCELGDIHPLQPGATLVIRGLDIAAACPGMRQVTISVRSPHIVATHARTLRRGREESSVILTNTARPARYGP